MSATRQAEQQAAADSEPGFLAVLDHLGVLRVSGEEAGAFLQGQLSCDVLGLAPQGSTFGAYCTPQGRMIASFLFGRDESGFFAVLSRDLAAATQKQLAKFVLRAKVRIADASEAIVVAGASGPQAERALAGSPGSSARLRDGRLLRLVPADLAPEILRGLEGAGAARWRWMDIRAGLPWISEATREQLIPQMVNLELIGGVSFDKGCYTGQEIVARTQHRGSVKRRMFLANVAAPARPGDALYGDDLGPQASGIVVNGEPSPAGGHDLLASVQISSKERSIVRLKSPDGPALRFLPLPYTVP